MYPSKETQLSHLHPVSSIFFFVTGREKVGGDKFLIIVGECRKNKENLTAVGVVAREGYRAKTTKKEQQKRTKEARSGGDVGSMMHALRSERNPTISSIRHPTNQILSIAVVDVMSRSSVTAPRKGASVNASRETMSRHF